jgi:hypothetical protein
MHIHRAINNLSQTFETKRLKNRGYMFITGDYAIEVHHRHDFDLVVTFSPRSPSKWKKPAAQRKAWGAAFIASRGASAIHVKSGRNSWYRGQELKNFFLRARDEGLFAQFSNKMTYGGSMGGFGALSFSGIIGATCCLAYNPQINLGPSVRHWENRFASASKLDWSDDICDIDGQIANVSLPVVVYDPCYSLDRMQVDLLSSEHVLRLRVPFVGHRMPEHLLNMKMLTWLFDQCRSGSIDISEFYKRARARRQLNRYYECMITAAGENNNRRQIIERYFKTKPEFCTS